MILPFDFAILNYIHNNWTNSFFDIIMPYITFLGNGGIIWVITCVFLLLNKKYRKNGYMMVITLFVCLIICNIILKPLIGRLRPFEMNPNVTLLIKKPLDFSFPSGHTLFSFAAATVLMFLNKKCGLVAMVIAFLIGFSRLYLYVHFPTDVFIGGLIGVLIGYIVCKSFRQKNK